MKNKSIALSVAASLALLPALANATETTASAPVVAKKATNSCCHTAQTQQKSMKPSASIAKKKTPEQSPQ